MIDFETSKKQIEALVEEFKENEYYYISNDFDEENAKVKFISKFFKILGWDVDNEEGSDPRFADVEFEDSIKINGKHKAPDYCFRFWGEKKFFVEAKAPHENLDTNKEHAFQLKRYTWSAKLPLGILTDFEELAIYEPKSTPKKHHNPTIDRIKYYKYTEYVENWEEIYNLFSKEAVRKGKFDNFTVNRHGDRRGTETVDSEFLKKINEWRLELAKNIAIRNKEISIEELNFAVQLIIDRIIFLRIAEDRGIEKYEQLKKLTELAKNEKGKYPVYEGFIELCWKADAKYNSGLFHFTEEADISLSADTLTPSLKVDDGNLKAIIDGLYYPDCPYEFSVISTEILGNIYEQFLGKVIRLTDGHYAKVEDKPEVKKAGGVYYTPQYIVEYIVENTVGELLKGKTPNQISKLRIVDPACGSGSFLLGAYQYLLDWHIEYYSNLEKPPKNVIYKDKGDVTKLTIQEKKRILLNNIYGVDIDSQAVEVTKLSLLLKVLEDMDKDVLESQQKLIQERALPYLGDNIKCGNSLISTDILDSDELSSDEIYNINPFNWEDEFSEIFSNGGFDVVIGNPPYVGEKGNKETFRYIKKTKWGKKYYYTKMDLFYYFYHKSLDLCKNKGYISFITTNYFLTADGAIKLRTDLKERSTLKKIINFNELQVFENAKGQHNIILILSKAKTKKSCIVYNSKLSCSLSDTLFKEIFKAKDVFNKISQNKLFVGDDNLIFLEGLSNDDKNSKDTIINSILNKIANGNELLNDIMSINAGADVTISKITKKHIDNFGSKFNKGEGVFVLTDDEFREKNFPKNELSVIKPFIKNSDIKRYFIKDYSKYLIYTNAETNIDSFPSIKEHLLKFKVILRDQMVRYNESVDNWFMLHRPRDEKIFLSEKIVLPYRSKINCFAYSDTPIYASRDVFFY